MYAVTARVGKSRIAFAMQTEEMYRFVMRRFRTTLPLSPEESCDLHITILPYDGISYDNGPIHISREGQTVIFTRCDYRMTADRDYAKAVIEAYDEFALKHALINLYSSWLIHEKRGLLVHSSCVVQNGRAWMFAGQSGAGKSTVAELSEPRPVLSDEATFIYIEDDGRVTVYDSPFRSEMENPCELEQAELHGIHYIIQSKEVERVPVSPGDGFILMLDKVFYWRHDEDETRNLFSLCKQIAHKVPSYQLYFQKNDTFWERIS